MNEKTDALPEINLKPVGYVSSTMTSPDLKTSGDGIEMEGDQRDVKKRVRKISEHVSQLVIDERLEGILDGIEEFSHILVLYWPHLIPEERRALRKVHPMGRKDLPEKGIFSTCSPARPNPVLVTAVQLLAREGNVLEVKGLEAVDGSPVIDIKPYMPHYYSPQDVHVAGWMRRIEEELQEA